MIFAMIKDKKINYKKNIKTNIFVEKFVKIFFSNLLKPLFRSFYEHQSKSNSYMSKIKLLIVILFLSVAGFAQNSIIIKGKIIDKNSKSPLESATIYISSVKDSTIADYTISDKNGNFSLSTKKINKPIFLKISFVGYEDYKQIIENLAVNKDFGILNIIEKAKNLGEVVIKSEAPPIRIKKDTLEFNAASFKVLPDSNVETLLKQLPGIEIDAKGKITVNGKEVNNIFVNGKPFFGVDGKVATKNLPSDIINKVQVTDTKTKEEELTGDAANSENKTINLTIQEDKNKGLFGKFSAGKGSNNRYESSGLINYFKDKQKFSFLGGSNNINAIGFSMDEIFDSMGGGRNVYSSNDGSFNIDGQQFGGGNGITQSNIIGLNYADELVKKKFEPNGSYFYNSAETNNNSRSKFEILLPKSVTESSEDTRRIANGHNLNFQFEYKIDSLTTLNIRPNLKKSNARTTSFRKQKTTNEFDVLANDSQAYSDKNSLNSTFSNELVFVKNSKKKGKSFTLRFNNNNKNIEDEVLNISETNFYKNNKPSTIRNLIQKSKNVDDTYHLNISQNLPITDTLSFSIGAKYSYSKSIDRQNTFNFEPVNANYSIKNDSLSNEICSKINNINPFASFGIRKKKYSGRINFGTEIIQFGNTSSYLSKTTNLNKNYIFPNIDGYFNYNISKTKSIYLNYNFRKNLPTANQLLPVENISNPLSTFLGNPDLLPTTSHNFYFGFNNYQWATRSGFYLYSGGNLYQNQVVSSTTFDSNFKSKTVFQNTDFSYNIWGGFEYSKSYKIEKNKFKYSVGLSSNFNLVKGITNNILYSSRSYNLNPSLELSFDLRDFLTLSPSYNYSFSKNNFTNYTINQSSNFTHNFKLETTSRWPKNWIFGNDFGYIYNANISDGFKKDFYLWNVSLGYNFLKEKWLIKAKVYDLLNQNINTSRTITPTEIQDVQNTVLKRYLMFSLTYKIEKFGGKKKNEWEE